MPITSTQRPDQDERVDGDGSPVYPRPGDATEARIRDMAAMVRDLSTHDDPQAMVLDFGRRFRRMYDLRGFLSISRRKLDAPFYRVTRSSRWGEDVNPWQQSDVLPVLEGGLLADLIYGEEPVIIDDLDVADDDPAARFLDGYRSLLAVPHYDNGLGLNMAINLHPEPHAFDREAFPEHILQHNLFGRATHNLVLAKQLREAHELLDKELKTVGEIQRSLLPQALPDIAGVDLATHYQAAGRAGGDYFDIFKLAGGRFGLLLCDVSGHGTPAAVVMAVTHALANAFNGPCEHPGELLCYLNARLVNRYDTEGVMFVTAFYGVYDPATRALTYASAGHPPARHVRGGRVSGLDGVGGIPLGVTDDPTYDAGTAELAPGDRLLVYTDGITEAFNPLRKQYGQDRLDQLLAQPCASAGACIRAVLDDVATFARGTRSDDDQSLLALHLT